MKKINCLSICLLKPCQTTMYSLKHKVAIITGGANGIGAEIVREFLNEESKFVAILDINEAQGLSLENELKIKHGEKKVQFYAADVTNDQSLLEVFHKVIDEFGEIDVIVNNAAIAKEGPSSFKKEIEINFTGLVASSLKGLELMRKDRGGKGGTIINISSIVALSQISPSLFVYAATKSAVLHFSNCIGMEEYFRHTNVRVLTVCFGVTDTSMAYNVEGIDDITTESLVNMLKKTQEKSLFQSPTAAAQGVVQAYESGMSGSTWVDSCNKTIDITADVKDVYKMMSKYVNL